MHAQPDHTANHEPEKPAIEDEPKQAFSLTASVLVWKYIQKCCSLRIEDIVKNLQVELEMVDDLQNDRYIINCKSPKAHQARISMKKAIDQVRRKIKVQTFKLESGLSGRDGETILEEVQSGFFNLICEWNSEDASITLVSMQKDVLKGMKKCLQEAVKKAVSECRIDNKSLRGGSHATHSVTEKLQESKDAMDIFTNRMGSLSVSPSSSSGSGRTSVHHQGVTAASSGTSNKPLYGQAASSDTDQTSSASLHHHTASSVMSLSTPCVQCGESKLMGKYIYSVCGVYCPNCYHDHRGFRCQNCKSVIPGKCYGGRMSATIDEATRCLEVALYHPGVKVCELALV